jgi:hypothetical protein
MLAEFGLMDIGSTMNTDLQKTVRIFAWPQKTLSNIATVHFFILPKTQVTVKNLL